MTGYVPVYTKSAEKGSFLTYDVVDGLYKKGIFFTANRTLGVPKWVKLFAVYGCKQDRKTDMKYELCLYLK